jgi:tetratricopeptide (TPR) repeat protein
MLSGIIIAISGILIVLTARSATTLFHELGHAIPALLFTRQPVIVHVGSYGDIRHSLKLKLGRLTLFLKFNILDWKLGLCQHEGRIPYLQLFIIILGGPLISLIIAACMLWGLFQEQIADLTKVVMGLFLLSYLWDFLVNIVPVSRPLKLHDGSLTFNDGNQLMRLIRLGAHSAAYDLAMQDWEKGNTAQAAEQMQDLQRLLPNNRIVAQSLIELLLAQQSYQPALSSFLAFYGSRKKQPHEYELLGDIYLGMQRWEKAVKAYNAYLYHNYQDYSALNKKAKALLEMGEYDRAAEEIRISLRLEPENNYLAFLNQGRLSMQQREYSTALRFLKKAKALKRNSPDVYLWLAFYYETSGNWTEALGHFQEAKKLGTRYHGIDFKISELEKHENTGD